MSSYPPHPLGSRFITTLRSFLQDPGLPFAHVLTEDLIRQAAGDDPLDFGDGDGDVYNAPLTLWAFLGQVLSGSKSCVAAVARVMVLLAVLERPPCSAHTGAYCKARRKLPEPFLRRLTAAVGTAVEDAAPAAWRWHGRRVVLADGATATMTDTVENQAAYPQPTSQRPGLGFPILRFVALLTLATACVLDVAVGPYQGKETGEPALFRELLASLRPGDVVVADRYYCSYWLLALLADAGVDVVFRLHQRRQYDFRRGRRLGAGDHVVTWAKPARPSWMDEADYARLPATLTVREVRFRVDRRGCRSKEIVAATTLRDAAAYPKSEVADLYHERWHVELDLRAIKQTLRMDMLVCKTPDLVRRELWVHLLGYNLIRKVMSQAAAQEGLSPRQLSFAGAVQMWEAFRWLLVGGATARATGVVLLRGLTTHRVGNRPGRWEPRRVKRRPKSYGRLTEPRAQARARLASGRPAPTTEV